jgi:hypothetical protein
MEDERGVGQVVVPSEAEHVADWVGLPMVDGSFDYLWSGLVVVFGPYSLTVFELAPVLLHWALGCPP